MYGKKRDEWFQKLNSLKILSECDYPSIAICLELGPALGPDVAVPDFNMKGARRSSQGKPQRIDIVKRPTVACESGDEAAKFEYAILCRSISLADVVPESDDSHEAAVYAFNSLLVSHVDPAESLNVESIHRCKIKTVFKTQPYMSQRRPKRRLEPDSNPSKDDQP